MPSIHPSIHPCQLCQMSEASMKNLTWLDFKLTMVVWSKSQMRQSKVRRRGGEATHPPTNSIFLLPLFAGVHKIIPWSKKIVEGDPKKGPLGSKKLSKSVKILGWGREEANPPSPVVLLVLCLLLPLPFACFKDFWNSVNSILKTDESAQLANLF